MFFQRLSRPNLLGGFKSLILNENKINILALTNQFRSCSLESSKTEDSSAKNSANKSLNKAMKAYLERAREHDEFMSQQSREFQIGKRHLANMMGEDPETFTQEDIDNAIEYLFPSGLYDKKARPMMKPPEEIFPQRKAAEFDETGRPHHFLFYTRRPNYYNLLHNMVQHMQDLNKFEDVMIRKGIKPDPNLDINLSGYKWISKELLEKKLLESLTERDYDMFLKTIERLIQLPYSHKLKDFIFEYLQPLVNQGKTLEVAQLQYDPEGRAYVTTYECLRKRARGDVTIRSPGTGKVSINGQDITYFKDTQSREQLLFPLIFTNMINKVDIECNVEGGGTTAQAGALRWGIAWGLRSFVSQDLIEKMRIAGLLTRDYRRKERKKPGRWGARRMFTWKKR